MDSMFLFMYFYYCCYLFSFTTWKIVKVWYRLPRRIKQSPSFEGFRIQLHVVKAKRAEPALSRSLDQELPEVPFQLGHSVESQLEELTYKVKQFFICKECAQVMYETLGLKFKVVDNKDIPETFQYNGQLKLHLFIKHIKFIKKQACHLSSSFFLTWSDVEASFLELVVFDSTLQLNAPFSLYECVKICILGCAWEINLCWNCLFCGGFCCFFFCEYV